MKQTGMVRMRLAWWVRPYLAAVQLSALITGRNPDMDKVQATVARGILVVMKPAPTFGIKA